MEIVTDAAVLHLKSRHLHIGVEGVTAQWKKLAEEMRQYVQQDGVGGLAAVQVGHKVRMIAFKDDEGANIIVNPKIVKAHGHQFSEEGCLSIPGKVFKTKRPEIVKVTGFNIIGMPMIVRGKDLLAAILCHEIDHLEGILISDIGREV